MSFNESVRNLNVRKYLSERDKLSCQEKAGHRDSVIDNPADLMEKQAEIQEKRIGESLKREVIIKKANKELKKIIKEGNKRFKRDMDEINKITENR
jgi:hypothetical protein